MSFDLHIPSKADTLPATISLRARKAGVTCYISVKFELLKQAGATDKSLYDILIGSGDDAGKMRVRPNKEGRTSSRRMRDYAILNIGHVPAFPDEEMDKQRCDAKVVDSSVEIALPDWSAIEFVRETDHAEQSRRGIERASSPPPLSRGVNGAKTQVPSAQVSRNGITVDLTADDESISFGKKTMDLNMRQAAIAAALLRAMPSNVGREWLIKNALPGLGKTEADVFLDAIFRELEKACAGVGLLLKVTKGVGAALAIAGAK